MKTSPKAKAKESIEKRDPFTPIKSLAPEKVEPGVENDRLVMAEKNRIEVSKQTNPKPEEVTPDHTLHSQDSAA